MSTPGLDGTAVPAPERLYIGSYTPTSGGRGAGITVLERPAPGVPWQAAQVVEADDPSFLVVVDGALHAASETAEGRVLSYTVSAGSLVAASSASSGGSSPCHLVVDPVRRDRVVGNVLHVRLAEVQDGVVHGCRDAADHGVLLALDLVERVQHLAVVHVQLAEVVEDVVDELGEALAGHDGRVHLA